MLKTPLFLLFLLSQFITIFAQNEIVLQQGLNGYSGVYDQSLGGGGLLVDDESYKLISVSHFHC